MGEAKKANNEIALRDSAELANEAGQVRAAKEVEALVVSAKRFPRDELAMYANITRACQRPKFASEAFYSYPRGGQQIKGPSVNLAREMARMWGNTMYGIEVVRDDDDSRKIRAWAWDIETNTRTFVEDDFKKLIYRKNKGWLVPDERDLRELTNRRGAICARNAILQLMPRDYVDDALQQCYQTVVESVGKDRGEAIKKVVMAFDELSITTEMIAERYGCDVGNLTNEDIAELRGIYKSIKDGNSKRMDYFGGKKEPETEKATIRVEDLKVAEQQEPEQEVPDARKAEPSMVDRLENLGSDDGESNVNRVIDEVPFQAPSNPVRSDEVSFDPKVLEQLRIMADVSRADPRDIEDMVKLAGYPLMDDPRGIGKNLATGKERKTAAMKIHGWYMELRGKVGE